MADSVNKVLTFHRTSGAGAESILAHGVDIDRSRIGSFGQGFYTATDADEFYGEVELQVAVRTLHPLVGHLDSVADEVDPLVRQFGTGQLTPEVAAAIRRVFLRQGYDGIIVRDGGGDEIDYSIALHGSLVKVVRP